MTKQLWAFLVLAIKSGIRDRVLHGILGVGLLFLLSIPVVAVFSMRQVLALAVSYSLSVISLLGLLLSVVLASGVLSRDLERRTIYTACSLPLSRTVYLLGRFLGFALLLFIALAIVTSRYSPSGKIVIVASARRSTSPSFTLGHGLFMGSAC